jgi:CRP-like cAMP-binding protein
VSELLDAHLFTAGLTVDERRALAEVSVAQAFPTDSLLIAEGQPATAFFLIVAGRVGIEIPLGGGGLRRLQTIEANNVVGWSWLIPPHRWEFDARALEPTTAVAIDADRLRSLFTADCALGLQVTQKLLVVIAERLKATRLQLLDVYAPTPGNRTVATPDLTRGSR